MKKTFLAFVFLLFASPVFGATGFDTVLRLDDNVSLMYNTFVFTIIDDGVMVTESSNFTKSGNEFSTTFTMMGANMDTSPTYDDVLSWDLTIDDNSGSSSLLHQSGIWTMEAAPPNPVTSIYNANGGAVGDYNNAVWVKFPDSTYHSTFVDNLDSNNIEAGVVTSGQAQRPKSRPGYIALINDVTPSGDIVFEGNIKAFGLLTDGLNIEVGWGAKDNGLSLSQSVQVNSIDGNSKVISYTNTGRDVVFWPSGTLLQDNGWNYFRLETGATGSTFRFIFNQAEIASGTVTAPLGKLYLASTRNVFRFDGATVSGVEIPIAPSPPKNSGNTVISNRRGNKKAVRSTSKGYWRIR